MSVVAPPIAQHAQLTLSTQRAGPIRLNSPPLPWSAKSLHGDTNTDEMFIFTAILYLSQHGVDCIGGETGIADAMAPGDTVGRVELGLRVQPSVGRLLLFSSGAENMHEMLTLQSGERVAVQMWFACEGLAPGWGRPQRAVWSEQHGYGGPGNGSNVVGAEIPQMTTQLAAALPWEWRL
mmetsp:Transcript_11866/g.27155  ORF Transcript_11866/g.27155 Transcript_11866/m.27155 type:complete len:179 (-) Transcript_11866:196-732(-)